MIGPLAVPPASRGWVTALRLAIAVGLVAVTLAWVHPHELLQAVRQVGPFRLANAAALGLTGLALQWWRWYGLLAAAAPAVTLREAWHTLLVGFGLGLVSPGRLGELGRGAFSPPQRRTQLAALALVDRASSAAVCLVVAGVALTTVAPGWGGLAWVSLAGMAGVARWAWPRNRGRPIRRRVAAFLAPVRLLPAVAWRRLLGLSAVANAVLFVQFAVLLGPVDAGAVRLAQATPLVFGLKTMVPLSLVDLGVREAAAVVVFTRLQLDPAPAFGAAVLVFILNVLMPGLAGLVLVYRQVGRDPLGSPER